MNDNGPRLDSKTGIRRAARKGGASAGWLAVIAAGCVLFLLARATRWTEGVTIDDWFTLLLGALPFACFYFFGSIASRGTLFAFLSLAWILTLTVFLFVRLTPLVYAVDSYLHLVTEPPDYRRLVVSFCFSFLGTCLAAAFYNSRLRSMGISALVDLIAVWTFNAMYVWIFIYRLPPDLNFR
ncbi:steroid 5-alpha reductase family enzyme [Bradyrhizobium sp. AZCC 1588]|uniref:hypothetical protein n=1 Tax=unclassified Bradyrhizobium TaxID=2631580 RepID=UPI002FF08DF7